jgi:hypothetical protein
LDEHLLATPKPNVENKTKLLVELVEIFLHEEGNSRDGAYSAFSAFNRLLKDKKVRRRKKVNKRRKIKEETKERKKSR